MSIYRYTYIHGFERMKRGTSKIRKAKKKKKEMDKRCERGVYE